MFFVEITAFYIILFPISEINVVCLLKWNHDILKGKKMSKTLEQMADAVQKHQLTIYAITEIRHGKSETITIVPGGNCHNIYSVAKAFMITAIGMLESRGILSTDDLIFPFLADHFPQNYDPNWKKVRISHLLSHRFGIDRGFLDIDCEYAPDWGTDDYLSLVLNRQLLYEPGTEYQYSDAAFYLISRIFTIASGEKVDDFLGRELFTPMRFREFAFSKCPFGYPIGATGLYITTEDMAKLGQLYLQHGIYHEKSYLTEHFIKKTLGNFDITPAYGGFAKGGMLGQYLYFNCRKDQVIAFQGHNPGINAVKILMTAAESVTD